MTYHLPNLPKGKWDDIKTRKIQAANVVRTGLPGEQAATSYKEALRINVNSRTARKLRRAGAELVRP